VETVLGTLLQGVCVDSLDGAAARLARLAGGEVALFAPLDGVNVGADSLARRVGGDRRVQGLLAPVFCAASAEEAQQRARSLGPGESVVTPEGLWFGRNWARRVHAVEAEGGIIQRQKDLDALQAAVQERAAEEAAATSQLEAADGALAGLEQRRGELRAALDAATRLQGEAMAKLRAEEARQEQRLARAQRIEQERADLQQQYEHEQQALGQARTALAAAIEAMDADTQRRDAQLAERDSLRAALDAARAESHHSRDELHQAALRHQSLLTQSETIRDALARGREQAATLAERLELLETSRLENDNPLPELTESLESQLALRLESETLLTTARQALADVEHSTARAEQERLQIEKRAGKLREQLESRRLQSRACKHRQDTLVESAARRPGRTGAAARGAAGGARTLPPGR
jgi:chromosome segregation protein